MIDSTAYIVTVYGITRLILWSIKKNGLEKTLEDLRKNCKYDYPCNNLLESEEGWKMYLELLQSTSNLLELKEKLQ